MTLLKKGQIHRKDAKNAKKRKACSSAFSAKPLCPRRLNGFLQQSQILMSHHPNSSDSWRLVIASSQVSDTIRYHDPGHAKGVSHHQNTITPRAASPVSMAA